MKPDTVWHMVAIMPLAPVEVPESADQRVMLHDISWSQLEMFLAIRGDEPVPRITYLEGELQLMSPSRDHESIKSCIRRLLEAYAEKNRIDVEAYGSWTIRNAPRARAVEPDECYVIGDASRALRRDVPDLAIEVIWTSGGLEKLDVYCGLGVREVWFWTKGEIEIHVLADDRYERRDSSEVLPDLDVPSLARFVTGSGQSAAVRRFRAALDE